MLFIEKSYWVQYHYIVPWDYLTSEYGTYGIDCTSKFIRVCEALGYAFNLKSLSSEAARDALYKSLNENKSFADCIAEEEEKITVSIEEYLNTVKFI